MMHEICEIFPVKNLLLQKGKMIITPYLTFQDCGRHLASKGGGERCYPIDGHLYCRECNAARVYQWYKLSREYRQEPGLIV